MKKIALVSFLTLISTSTFADTAIFNMTKFPMQLTYHTCTQIPMEGMKCDTPQQTVDINAKDGNGKNYKIISRTEDQMLYIDQALIKKGSKQNAYTMDCGDYIGAGVISISDMGGTPVLVCQNAAAYALPTE